MKTFPSLNSAQTLIIECIEGPLLVIAGPGSGKTFSLVLRAVNLLLPGKAKPREIVLCTFSDKAAYELRDRFSTTARKLGYTADLSELKVSTIHGLCNRLITTHRHRTQLGGNYEVLDDLTQLLFIFDHLDEIIKPDANGTYLGKWKTKWGAIEGLRDFFNKITEELVDPDNLAADADPFLSELATAYKAYAKALMAENRIDFAHLQKLVYELLQDSEVYEAVTEDIRYVMVDEYQDTNYIQERILLRLSEKTGNICVVGDEDQSLYRFRGATVRNILEFPARVSNCAIVKLVTNYRSHQRIVDAYDRWMASSDWSNPNGVPFRYDKKIEPDLNGAHPDYPSIFAISGQTKRDEASRFAYLVSFLKESKVIEDYSQVALLLHSVRRDHSGPYIDALQAKGIPAFCPRARAYFDNDEVRLMVACSSGTTDKGGARSPVGRLRNWRNMSMNASLSWLASAVETIPWQ